MKIAGIKTDSIVDGPGVRLSIYVQGCSHRCIGCHNPETHDPMGGSDISIEQLLAIIAGSSSIDGVTLSGGEPFEQAAAVAALAEAIKRWGFDLVLFSGYTFEQLLTKSMADSNTCSLLHSGSILVDGPFIMAEQDYNLPYRGSRNQRLIDLPRSLKSGSAVKWSARWSCTVG